MKRAFLFVIPVLFISVVTLCVPSTASSEGKVYSREDFSMRQGYAPAGSERTQPVRTRQIDPQARPAYENGMQRHGMGGAFGSNGSHASSQPKDWPSGMFGPYDFK